VKARAFRFGTGRLERLSLVRTRRGGAMMARMPYRHITALRPQGGMNLTTITLTAVVMDLPDLGKERRNWR
jgi:hypothetical protein